MLLTLSVISGQGTTLGSSAYRVFDAQGGTIGRIDANDWVLPDPAKFVSSHHARIRCHNNVFYLQDISTNGTFLNSTDSPVSKSDLTALSDGDRILIGDYEILVQLIDDGSAAAPESAVPAPQAPPARQPSAPVAALLAEEQQLDSSDPLLMLGAKSPDRAALAKPPAQTPEPAVRASAPGAAPAGSIPDDWQLTGFNLPAPARKSAQRSAVNDANGQTAQSPKLRPEIPAPQATPPQPSTGQDERLTALFAALGLDAERLSPETFAEIGEIVRIVVQGLIEVLQSRTEVKNNFRVPMTSMRPVENNPLKFSLNVEDAVHNLFVKRNPGYLQPLEAFREGFRDVAFHQVAMLAGIRAAFNSLLARFDPEGLEETYDRKLKRTLLLGVAGKLKYWDLYSEQFEEYRRDAEATFQNLFGEDFAKAYYEQLQKLATTARLRKR